MAGVLFLAWGRAGVLVPLELRDHVVRLGRAEERVWRRVAYHADGVVSWRTLVGVSEGVEIPWQAIEIGTTQ